MQKHPPTADGKARVILWGLGALGSRMLKAFEAGISDVRIVGAIDHDPAMAGRKLSDVFPQAKGIDVVVHRTLEQALASAAEPVDVIYHMTESVLETIQPQLELAMSRGLNVISASEGMFHPGLRFGKFTDEIDAAARKYGVSITGCGINPGFVFDSLVLTLARISSAVTGVKISRVIDVTGTGPHDIDHVGYGLTQDEFKRRIASGRIVGHMGMPDSIAAVAERLNIPIDRIDEFWETAVADFPVDSASPLGILEPGRVIGITQIGAGMVGERRAIEMRLIMYYDPARHGLEEADDIVIEGTNRIHNTTKPAMISIYGAGLMILNATNELLRSPPGLRNILDFSMGGHRRGGYRFIADPKRPPVPGTTWVVRQPA
jgi:4-hydroxy-tetrahydrodipicolinate reductase